MFMVYLDKVFVNFQIQYNKRTHDQYLNFNTSYINTIGFIDLFSIHKFVFKISLAKCIGLKLLSILLIVGSKLYGWNAMSQVSLKALTKV